jgi:hypothetical protein
MADFTIKKDDTRPKLVRYLKQTVDGVQTAIPLTTASAVRFIMKQSSLTAVQGIASINDPTNGAVTYVWTTGDTATSGQYSAEFEILWNDGGYETIPNDGYFSIEIVDDLGGTV